MLIGGSPGHLQAVGFSPPPVHRFSGTFDLQDLHTIVPPPEFGAPDGSTNGDPHPGKGSTKGPIGAVGDPGGTGSDGHGAQGGPKSVSTKHWGDWNGLPSGSNNEGGI